MYWEHFVKVKLNTFQFEITCQLGPEGDTDWQERSSWLITKYSPQVDLRHEEEIRSPSVATYDASENSPTVDVGIDLTEFYMSVEWDILEVPAKRNVKFYTCCDEPYLDITFNITMRRKTLFYTVNLIIPCMGISFLTILVFYLPSDSGEKVGQTLDW